VNEIGGRDEKFGLFAWTKKRLKTLEEGPTLLHRRRMFWSIFAKRRRVRATRYKEFAEASKVSMTKAMTRGTLGILAVLAALVLACAAVSIEGV